MRTSPPSRGRCWIDDEITDRDCAYVTAHHPAPALLHRVDPRHGLRDNDFMVLAAFAARCTPTAA
ncbi:hypothetical protein [Streptomyces sp. NPDC059788]|uniref:hypothetical protein n=1 Tax=Streptomyces sp. NPDC059788 TaxID=3346948 RepID=UPI00365425A5